MLGHDVDGDRLTRLAGLAFHMKCAGWKLRGVELFHHPLHSLKSKGQLAADQVHEQGIRRVAEVVSRATGLWHGQDDVEARP